MSHPEYYTMLTKDGLKNQFAKDWKKHYQIELF